MPSSVRARSVPLPVAPAPSIAATGDAAQLIALLAWCRDNGVVAGDVTVGTAHISIAGERLTPAERILEGDAVTRLSAKTDEQARSELYSEYGGTAFRTLAALPSDDDEDEPSIGGDGG